MLVSGGADSVISFWQDVTEIEEEEQQAAEEDAILKQQDLANYMDVKDYRNAILLALSMDQPRRLFLLLSDILADSASPESQATSILGDVLANLAPGDVFRLLEYVRDWNAKSRDSDVAQTVLHTLMRSQSAATILKAVPSATGLEVEASAKPSATSIGDLIEALLPYTERHYARADRLEQESAFLDFVLAQMDEFVSIDDTPAAGR
jgi:U3 small nucleolar RNA-associated protein 13